MNLNYLLFPIQTCAYFCKARQFIYAHLSSPLLAGTGCHQATWPTASSMYGSRSSVSPKERAFTLRIPSDKFPLLSEGGEGF